MPLYCSAPQPSIEQFEFIDCSTISIGYDILGHATIGFTVISSNSEISGNYTHVWFGGVEYKGYIKSVQVSPIMGTAAFNFRFEMVAFGC